MRGLKRTANLFVWFLVLVLLIAVLNEGGKIVAEVPSIPGWVSGIFFGLANILGTVGVIILAIVGIRLLFKFGPWLMSWMGFGEDKEPEAESKPNTSGAAEAESILNASKRLRDRLDSLEKTATVEAIDSVAEQVALLVGLVKSLIATANAKKVYASQLQAIRYAVLANDRDELARLAGEIEDRVLSDLILTTLAAHHGADWFMGEFGRAVMVQMGQAQRQADSYLNMAGSLAGEVGQIKMRLAEVQQGLMIARAVRPLTKLGDTLGDMELALGRLQRPTSGANQYLPTGNYQMLTGDQ